MYHLYEISKEYPSQKVYKMPNWVKYLWKIILENLRIEIYTSYIMIYINVKIAQKGQFTIEKRSNNGLTGW